MAQGCLGSRAAWACRFLSGLKESGCASLHPSWNSDLDSNSVRVVWRLTVRLFVCPCLPRISKLGRVLHPLLLRLSRHRPGQWLSRPRHHFLLDPCHPEGHCVPSITRLVLPSGDSSKVALLWQPRLHQQSGRCKLVLRSVAQGLLQVVMRNGPLGKEP
jgi:hypothetical protein